MKNKYIFLSLLCPVVFLFFISCEKEVEFKGDELDPLIVVNGIVTEGDTVAVLLTKSKSVFEEEYLYTFVTNAEVNLYVNDVFAETLTPQKAEAWDTGELYDTGEYAGSVKAVAGKTYRLEIAVDGFDPISCETTVPKPVEILAWDTTSVGETGYSGFASITEFNVEFNDNGQQHNYYRIQSTSKGGRERIRYTPDGTMQYTDTIVIEPESSEWIDILNAQLNDAINDADEFISGTPDNRFAIFKDDSFNGSKMKLRFQIRNNFYYYYPAMGSSNESDGNFRERNISLFSLSKEYYEYLNTANLHYYFEDDFFSEPVQVYSNIKGGIGIWGAVARTSFSVLEGNYPLDDKVYVERDGYYYGY
ncbi:MAG: DUF4249 domain-containing protein [Draconibacterium sp.]